MMCSVSLLALLSTFPVSGGTGESRFVTVKKEHRGRHAVAILSLKGKASTNDESSLTVSQARPLDKHIIGALSMNPEGTVGGCTLDLKHC